MTATLSILRAGPAMTIQDLGRPFHVAKGLSTGGAADRIALFEAAALLNAQTVLPAIEMMGLGGTFRTNAPLRFALTGAKMRVTLDDTVLAWNRTHTMQAGQILTIGAVENGSYGYLTPAAPIACDSWLASQSTHLLAGIGRILETGDAIALGVDSDPGRVDHKITPSDRFSGGTIRMVAGPQTDLFSHQTQTRFFATQFIRSPQANRQGVKLDAADTFAPETPKGLASDFIQTGDIQMTGEGVPYVLQANAKPSAVIHELAQSSPWIWRKLRKRQSVLACNFGNHQPRGRRYVMSLGCYVTGRAAAVRHTVHSRPAGYSRFVGLSIDFRWRISGTEFDED